MEAVEPCHRHLPPSLDHSQVGKVISARLVGAAQIPVLDALVDDISAVQFRAARLRPKVHSGQVLGEPY